jgi:guanylate kinase
VKPFPVAVCGPSGAGKTTVARALVASGDPIIFSVSATTRAVRPGERPGLDYHFVTREEFRSGIDAARFLEWAEVHGELYGTPRANLEEAERQGKVLVLDIDVQGARQVQQARPDTVTIFLLPPSYDVLMERLRARGSEDSERLRRRLQTARRELQDVASFQYAVVNDHLEGTVNLVRAIITGEGQRLSRRSEAVEMLRRELLRRLGP